MRTYPNIIYSPMGHEKQKLDMYLPDAEAFPVFLYFHGGGIEAGDKWQDQPFLLGLAEKGVGVVSANYRLYPEAKYPEFIEDAAAAVAWVKSHIEEYGHCTKLFIGGSSAGGYISQMLCFDKRYLGAHGIDSDSLDGYYLDAGQPTTHFNVLRERGVHPYRVIIDEAAPIYHVESGRDYAPMKIVVSDRDMENRLEQTQLLVSTLKHLGCDMSKVDFEIIEDSVHCGYVGKVDEDGKSVFAEMVYDYIKLLA